MPLNDPRHVDKPPPRAGQVNILEPGTSHKDKSYLSPEPCLEGAAVLRAAPSSLASNGPPY